MHYLEFFSAYFAYSKLGKSGSTVETLSKHFNTSFKMLKMNWSLKNTKEVF